MIGRQAVTVNMKLYLSLLNAVFSSSAPLFQCVLVYKITSEVPFLCFVYFLLSHWFLMTCFGQFCYFALESLYV